MANPEDDFYYDEEIRGYDNEYEAERRLKEYRTKILSHLVLFGTDYVRAEAEPALVKCQMVVGHPYNGPDVAFRFESVKATSELQFFVEREEIKCSIWYNDEKNLGTYVMEKTIPPHFLNTLLLFCRGLALGKFFPDDDMLDFFTRQGITVRSTVYGDFLDFLDKPAAE